MTTIDALLEDGRNALEDLQHSSPSGGLVRSEWRSGSQLAAGDLIRKADGWCVILRAGTVTVGSDGRVLDTVPAVDYLSPAGRLGSERFWSGAGAEVRTDARIDPGTLPGIEPHEYTAQPDAEYPHLVRAHCSCGWHASGFTREQFAPTFHAQHVTAAQRELQNAA